MRKEIYLLKTIFCIIVIFTIINLSLRIIDVKNRVQYWNTKDIDSDFISYFKKENSRMGWINLESPEYNCFYDSSFYWFRFLLMPTQLDNRSKQDRIILKFSKFEDVMKFSKDKKYRIIGLIGYFSAKFAFLEKIK